MILGRNTQQLLGGLAVVLGVCAAFVSPDFIVYIGRVGAHLSTILAFCAALVAGLMAWIAQTSTTPVSDPRLPAGTTVTVTDAEGTAIGQHTVAA